MVTKTIATRIGCEYSVSTMVSYSQKLVAPDSPPFLRLSLFVASRAGKSLATNGTPISTSSQKTCPKGTSPLPPLIQQNPLLFFFSFPFTVCLTSMLFSSDALDELQLKRYCCRRMVLTHVDLIEKLLHYNRACLVSAVKIIHTSSSVPTVLTGFFSLSAMERTKDRGANTVTYSSRSFATTTHTSTSFPLPQHLRDVTVTTFSCRSSVCI